VGLDVLDPILYDALVADELARLTVFPEMDSLDKDGEINIGPGPYDLVSADTSKAAAEQYRGRVSQIGLEMMRCQPELPGTADDGRAGSQGHGR
jgi:hypothetical protein